jgi:hypothetical protein
LAFDLLKFKLRSFFRFEASIQTILVIGSHYFFYLFCFLILLFNVAFKKNRFYDFFYFFIELSQSHGLIHGLGGLTWVSPHHFSFNYCFYVIKASKRDVLAAQEQ